MPRLAFVLASLLLSACSDRQAPPAGAPPVRTAGEPPVRTARTAGEPPVRTGAVRTGASTAKDPAAARARIAAGAVVIDVRTPGEFAEGHLPQAVNIPVEELATRTGEVAALAGGDKAQPVVVYCASGNRARGAVTMLSAAGHADVVNGGGLDDLQ